MDAATLAQLKDIHLPPPIGWWPPAPGWWALLALAMIAGGALYWLLRRYRRRWHCRQAQRLLATCWQTYREQGDGGRWVNDVLLLMRRTLHATGQRANSAAAEALPTGVLLAHLDAQTGGELARAIPLATLAVAPYRPQAEPITETQARQLYEAASRWLKRGGSAPC